MLPIIVDSFVAVHSAIASENALVRARRIEARKTFYARLICCRARDLLNFAKFLVTLHLLIGILPYSQQLKLLLKTLRVCRRCTAIAR